MNKWHAFVNYAKENPTILPKDMKSRAKIYHEMQDKCKCGTNDVVCDVMKIKKVIKDKPYNANKDHVLLQAKIKAYEDIVALKDRELEEAYKEITRLERYISKLEKKI